MPGARLVEVSMVLMGVRDANEWGVLSLLLGLVKCRSMGFISCIRKIGQDCMLH